MTQLSLYIEMPFGIMIPQLLSEYLNKRITVVKFIKFFQASFSWGENFKSVFDNLTFFLFSEKITAEIYLMHDVLVLSLRYFFCLYS